MKPADHIKSGQPGFHEAISPVIGNGAFWESNHHDQNLRAVDPSITLDEYLIDNATIEKITASWNQQLRTGIKDIKAEPVDNLIKEDASDIMPDLPKKAERRIVASTKPKDPLPDWLRGDEDEILSDKPVEDNSPAESEEEIVPAPFVKPEGKRVRKAVKKIQKEKKVIPSHESRKAEPDDQELSPFTRWLKTLRGSEYIHPHDDDFGLAITSFTGQDGISETFADLLARQGYREQAIDMYKLLMAKYPEKSSFFAAKIEALK